MKNDIQLAEAVRQGCIEAALKAYEEGGISGLCAEGRWELAIQGLRCLDLSQIISDVYNDKKV
jgi:hypothetical protein